MQNHFLLFQQYSKSISHLQYIVREEKYLSTMVYFLDMSFDHTKSAQTTKPTIKFGDLPTVRHSIRDTCSLGKMLSLLAVMVVTMKNSVYDLGQFCKNGQMHITHSVDNVEINASDP